MVLVLFCAAVFAQSRSLQIAPSAKAVETLPPQERRVALVVGNNAYRMSPLQNPKNDALAVAEKLGALGFDVSLRLDQDRAHLNRAIASFREKMSAPNTIALFFFAGHGVQYRGRNYLIPIDAQIESEEQVAEQALDLAALLESMGKASTVTNIVILDACRDNPFANARSGSQGLVPVDAPSGTLIAFATAPGSVASDGSGQNGVYTANLLKHLGERGQPIETIFKRVRLGVMQDTGRAQIPWENSSMTSDFYFAPGTAGQESAESESASWQALDETSSVYEYVAFLGKYPKSERRQEALTGLNHALRRVGAPVIEVSDLAAVKSEVDFGAAIRDLSPGQALSRGARENQRAYVSFVLRDQTAGRAGIQRGDILVAIDGHPIGDVRSATEYLLSRRPGEPFAASVLRNRQLMSIKGVFQRAPVYDILQYIAVMRGRAGDIPGMMKLLDQIPNLHPLGQDQLGRGYMAGVGVPKDQRRGIALIASSMEAGLPEAAFRLGLSYAEGEGVPKDETKAFVLIRSAAERAVPEAIPFVASFLAVGRGVRQDFAEARKWAAIGAEQGDAQCLAMLGEFSELGQGGPKDLSEAVRYYRRAAAVGNKTSQDALKRLGAQ